MGISDPLDESIKVIILKRVKIKLIETNSIGLSAPRADSLEIIDLQTVQHYWGLTQWALLPLGPTINHH